MPKFQNVSCSQCGEEFGPGDSGFSHCSDHWSPGVRMAMAVFEAGLAKRRELLAKQGGMFKVTEDLRTDDEAAP